jgi:hypothetical protein
MSYYGARGDYYGGGRNYYRRGDPGFFSSIGNFLKNTVAPAVLTAVNPALGAVYTAARTATRTAVSTVVKHPVLSGAGAAAVAAGGEYIANARRGGTSRTLAPMRAQGAMRMVGGSRGRRMNVTNSKALRRAIRRARGFEKLARKVLGFSSPHKPKGRVYFKKSRKK